MYSDRRLHSFPVVPVYAQKTLGNLRRISLDLDQHSSGTQELNFSIDHQETVKMATQKLERAKWHAYFDQVSQSLRGKPVEVRIVGPHLGDYIQGEKLPLIGLTYDPKDDVFEVATDRIDHLVQRPKTIYIETDAGQLRSVQVIDAEQNKQIIVFEEWVSLSPPTT
jgi:hypothetical protein